MILKLPCHAIFHHGIGAIAEKWSLAAKEGLMIYNRGAPLSHNLPDDLLERMLDFVNHVLATLALLFETPGRKEKLVVVP
jgi:hypothetical protein